MALVDNAWYVNYGNGSSTGYYAITAWATGTVIAAGAIRRQLAAPAVGSERVFIAVVGGTTHATTEPTWVITRGGKTTDNTVTWQECTGIAALNGDATNTPSWTISATPPGGVKGTAVTLGQVIKRDNGASYQICTTAGTAGSGTEPAFSDTAGTTTADNTVTWTSLGVVGNFTGWQAPHARLANAFAATWGQAGNSFYLASEHAETRSTAMTNTSPGIAANPCFVYCVTKTNVPPTSANLTTGASITTTGNSTIGNNGSAYFRGITFSCGSSTGTARFTVNAGANSSIYYDNCTLICGSTQSATTSGFACGTSPNIFLSLNNTTVQFGATGQTFSISGTMSWTNTPSAIQGATLPTTLFSFLSSVGANVIINGVDLSAIGAGATLFASSSGTSQGTYAVLVDCKLGSSVTITSTPPSAGGAWIDIVNSDSAGTNYRQERYRYAGTQITETTIVRSGGASDGTTSLSWNITTTANSKWVFPFEAAPIAIWNDTVGSSVTVTLYGVWGGGAVPNNDDVWMDVVYLGSAASPKGSTATASKADNLASGSALTSDSSTWGGSTTKFKMSVTFTPQQKGLVYIYVKAAKASSTFYIDPKPVLT